MADPTRDEPTLRSISRATLAAYLELQEWSHVDDWPGTARIYAKTIGSRQERIWVPQRETFSDYADNMDRSIGLLADVEERTRQDVLVDIKATNSDVVRIGMMNDTGKATMSLQAAEELMENSYTMISSAARAVQKPRAAYLGPMTNEVAEFVSSVVPAPTDFSTFGLRLLLPEWTENEQSDMWEADPFSRRAATSLSSSLRAIDAALSLPSPSESYEHMENCVLAGVSANLCGALAGLAVQARTYGNAFQVGITWSKVRPPKNPSPLHIPISTHAGKLLAGASQHLRSRASFPDESIRADVVLLAREPREEEGEVLLLVEADTPVRRIYAELNSRDYQVAIEAHKQKVQVLVDGDLVPAGRNYKLLEPRNMRLGPSE